MNQKQEEQQCQIQNKKMKKKKNKKMMIEMNDFPCGPNGFELVSMFCYNNGKIQITVSNVLILHCSALYLDMTEEFFTNNLIQQTQDFLVRIYHWTWNDTLLSLKSCVSFHSYAEENSGILDKIMLSLLAKIAQSSDPSLLLFTPSSPSSSPSSPESNNRRLSFQATPKTIRHSFPCKAWWFQDLDSLPPQIIDKFLRCIGCYKNHNNNLVLTRFLIDYLKKSVPSNNNGEYSSIAESAAYGVIFVGKNTFSCRTLFWVLRIVSCFGLSEECRMEMERLIGGNLEQATLDDLLVCGHHMGLYYDVNFVIRLVKLFVESSNNDNESESGAEKMRKVGRLIDKYLREVSADQNLKISKFLGVAESLPDSARDCFDSLYRAIDIYLESHPMIAFEERSRLCRCLNYNKLSFEVCKDLAKNPRIPPRIAMQALISQKEKIPASVFAINGKGIMDPSQIIMYSDSNTENFLEEKEDMKVSLESMKLRVRELEKLCNQMKNQMLRFGANSNDNGFLSPSCSGNVQRFC
ncbi:hypothetical protein PIB30_043793 [Stylosanthes scabra]|uniref:NPH3 domain-containing protein n=1 Tax=Stylosanthes scabra TaxID=79078 RepID=A0ABU6SFJ2_9FABA|nr:hypothetical protein [Stylosanthes scabra]